MPGTITRLAQTALSATSAVLYTVPANNALVDESIYMFNDDTVSRSIDLRFVPSGGSPLDDYVILASSPLAGKTGMLVQPKQRIDTGGTIRAYADMASKVAVAVSGVLVNTSTDSTLIKRFAQLQLTNSLSTVYTATPGSIMDAALWFYNFDSSPRTINLQFIPSGGSPSLGSSLLNVYTLPALSGVFLQPRQVIEVGGTIRANADVSSKVTLAASGIQA